MPFNAFNASSIRIIDEFEVVNYILRAPVHLRLIGGYEEETDWVTDWAIARLWFDQTALTSRYFKLDPKERAACARSAVRLKPEAKWVDNAGLECANPYYMVHRVFPAKDHWGRPVSGEDCIATLEHPNGQHCTHAHDCCGHFYPGHAQVEFAKGAWVVSQAYVQNV